MTPDQLAEHSTVDLTTIGRRSGSPATVEIWWFRVDGRFVITGTPGPRDWYANVLRNPDVTISVGGHVVTATARPVRDEGFRRKVFTEAPWYVSQSDMGQLVERAPMIELDIKSID